MSTTTTDKSTTNTSSADDQRLVITSNILKMLADCDDDDLKQIKEKIGQLKNKTEPKSDPESEPDAEPDQNLHVQFNGLPNYIRTLALKASQEDMIGIAKKSETFFGELMTTQLKLLVLYKNSALSMYEDVELHDKAYIKVRPGGHLGIVLFTTLRPSCSSSLAIPVSWIPKMPHFWLESQKKLRFMWFSNVVSFLTKHGPDSEYSHNISNLLSASHDCLQLLGYDHTKKPCFDGFKRAVTREVFPNRAESHTSYVFQNYSHGADNLIPWFGKSPAAQHVWLYMFEWQIRIFNDRHHLGGMQSDVEHLRRLVQLVKKIYVAATDGNAGAKDFVDSIKFNFVVLAGLKSAFNELSRHYFEIMENHGNPYAQFPSYNAVHWLKHANELVWKMHEFGAYSMMSSFIYNFVSPGQINHHTVPAISMNGNWQDCLSICLKASLLAVNDESPMTELFKAQVREHGTTKTGRQLWIMLTTAVSKWPGLLVKHTDQVIGHFELAKELMAESDGIDIKELTQPLKQIKSDIHKKLVSQLNDVVYTMLKNTYGIKVTFESEYDNALDRIIEVAETEPDTDTDTDKSDMSDDSSSSNE